MKLLLSFLSLCLVLATGVFGQDTACQTPQSFTITAIDNAAYDFGPGFGANPSLRLVAGRQYMFNVNAAGHPFWIKTQPTTGTANAFVPASPLVGQISGNGVAVGLVTFTPTAQTLPNPLFYQCEFHPPMTGTLTIVPDDCAAATTTTPTTVEAATTLAPASTTAAAETTTVVAATTTAAVASTTAAATTTAAVATTTPAAATTTPAVDTTTPATATTTAAAVTTTAAVATTLPGETTTAAAVTTTAAAGTTISAETTTAAAVTTAAPEVNTTAAPTLIPSSDVITTAAGITTTAAPSVIPPTDATTLVPIFTTLPPVATTLTPTVPTLAPTTGPTVSGPSSLPPLSELCTFKLQDANTQVEYVVQNVSATMFMANLPASCQGFSLHATLSDATFRLDYQRNPNNWHPFGSPETFAFLPGAPTSFVWLFRLQSTVDTSRMVLLAFQFDKEVAPPPASNLATLQELQIAGMKDDGSGATPTTLMPTATVAPTGTDIATTIAPTGTDISTTVAPTGTDIATTTAMPASTTAAAGSGTTSNTTTPDEVLASSEFSSSVFTYTYFIPSDLNSATLFAKPKDDAATVEANVPAEYSDLLTVSNSNSAQGGGEAANNASITLSFLGFGMSKFMLNVTSASGLVSRMYNITFVHPCSSCDSVATLDSITTFAPSTDLTPSFSKDVYSYKSVAAAGTTTISITATPTSANATLWYRLAVVPTDLNEKQEWLAFPNASSTNGTTQAPTGTAGATTTAVPGTTTTAVPGTTTTAVPGTTTTAVPGTTTTGPTGTETTTAVPTGTETTTAVPTGTETTTAAPTSSEATTAVPTVIITTTAAASTPLVITTPIGPTAVERPGEGQTGGEKSLQLNLRPGMNLVQIRCLASDMYTARIYTVIIQLEDNANAEEYSNADLSSLTVESGEGGGVTPTTMAPSTMPPSTTLEPSGEATTLAPSGEATTLAPSGQATTLVPGENATLAPPSDNATTVAPSGEATTLAPSGLATTTAAATTVAPSGAPSSTAAPSTTTSPSGGSSLKLTPEFDAKVGAYSITVDSTVDSITINAAAVSQQAWIFCQKSNNGGNNNNNATRQQGNATCSFDDLPYGNTYVNIITFAADGVNQRFYSLTIIRPATGEEVVAPRLTQLSCTPESNTGGTGGAGQPLTLSPAFPFAGDTNRSSFSVTLESGVSSFTLAASSLVTDDKIFCWQSLDGLGDDGAFDELIVNQQGQGEQPTPTPSVSPSGEPTASVAPTATLLPSVTPSSSGEATTLAPTTPSLLTTTASPPSLPPNNNQQDSSIHVGSGSLNTVLNFTSGYSYIHLRVVSAQTRAIRSYFITVFRKLSSGSDDTRLASCSVTSTTNTDLLMTPAFDMAQNLYRVNITDAAIQSVNVNVQTQDATALLYYYVGNFTSDAASSTWLSLSPTVPLSVSLAQTEVCTLVTLKIVSSDQTRIRFVSLIIIRSAMSMTAAKDASLSSLSLSLGGTKGELPPTSTPPTTLAPTTSPSTTLAPSGEATTTLAPSGEATTLAPSGEATTLAPSGEATTLAPSGEATTLAPSGEATTLAPSGEATTTGLPSTTITPTSSSGGDNSNSLELYPAFAAGTRYYTVHLPSAAESPEEEPTAAPTTIAPTGSVSPSTIAPTGSVAPSSDLATTISATTLSPSDIPSTTVAPTATATSVATATPPPVMIRQNANETIVVFSPVATDSSAKVYWYVPQLIEGGDAEIDLQKNGAFAVSTWQLMMSGQSFNVSVPQDIASMIVHIKVVAADCVTESLYVIALLRQMDDDDNNCDLSDLSIKEGELLPSEFDTDLQQYTLILGSNVSTVTVTAVPVSSNATVSVLQYAPLQQDLPSIASESDDKNTYAPFVVNSAFSTIAINVSTEMNSKVYMIEVQQASQFNVSSVALLQSLSFSFGSLIPSMFSPSTYVYRVEGVPYSVEEIEVMAMPLDMNAHVIVRASSLQSAFTSLSNEASATIKLNVGWNTVIIRVVAADGQTVQHYQCWIEREAKPIRLLSLTVSTPSGGGEQPTSIPTTLAPSTIPSATTALPTGSELPTTPTLSPSDILTTTLPSTTTIAPVSTTAAVPSQAPGSIQLMPTFAEDISSYNCTIDPAMLSSPGFVLSWLLTASESSVSLSYRSWGAFGDLSGGGGFIKASLDVPFNTSASELSNGNNFFQFRLATHDYSVYRDYFVNVMVTTGTDSGNNAGLVSLSLGNSWLLLPQFTPGIFAYFTTVDYNMMSIDVAAICADAAATVVLKLAGEENDNTTQPTGAPTTVAPSGEPGATTTAAPSGIPSTLAPSGEATTLAPSGGATLAPSGEATTILATTVAPTSAGGGATTTAAPGGGNNTGVSSTGSVTGKFTLAEGLNLLGIMVTSANSQLSLTYFVNIYRAPATPALDDNCALISLSIAHPSSGNSLVPDFNPLRLDYRLSVDAGVDALSLALRPQTLTSSIAISAVNMTDWIHVPNNNGDATHMLPLLPGMNEIRIRVVAADGVTSKVYRISVLRQEVRSDAQLAACDFVMFASSTLPTQAPSTPPVLPTTAPTGGLPTDSSATTLAPTQPNVNIGPATAARLIPAFSTSETEYLLFVDTDASISFTAVASATSAASIEFMLEQYNAGGANPTTQPPTTVAPSGSPEATTTAAAEVTTTAAASTTASAETTTVVPTGSISASTTPATGSTIAPTSSAPGAGSWTPISSNIPCDVLQLQPGVSILTIKVVAADAATTKIYHFIILKGQTLTQPTTSVPTTLAPTGTELATTASAETTTGAAVVTTTSSPSTSPTTPIVADASSTTCNSIEVSSASSDSNSTRLQPAFSPTVHSYYVMVNASVDTVTLRAQPSFEGQLLMVRILSVTDSNFTILNGPDYSFVCNDLMIGANNRVQLRVISADGLQYRDYFLVIERADVHLRFTQQVQVSVQVSDWSLVLKELAAWYAQQLAIDMSRVTCELGGGAGAPTTTAPGSTTAAPGGSTTTAAPTVGSSTTVTPTVASSTSAPTSGSASSTSAPTSGSAGGEQVEIITDIAPAQAGAGSSSVSASSIASSQAVTFISYTSNEYVSSVSPPVVSVYDQPPSDGATPMPTTPMPTGFPGTTLPPTGAGGSTLPPGSTTTLPQGSTTTAPTGPDGSTLPPGSTTLAPTGPDGSTIPPTSTTGSPGTSTTPTQEALTGAASASPSSSTFSLLITSMVIVVMAALRV